MPINEARQFGWATACVLSAESSIRDKLLVRCSALLFGWRFDSALMQRGLG